MNDLAILDPGDLRWKSYLETNEQATIFHHPAWIQLLSDCYHQQSFVAAVIDSDQRIRAGVPMVNARSFLTGHRWASLPFTDHCAPLYDDFDWLKVLEDRLLEKYHRGEAPSIELRWEYPQKQSLHQLQTYVLSLLRLDSQPEVIASGIDHKYRRLPRVAQEKGAHAVWGSTLDDIEKFYTLHTLTRRRLGVPVQPKRFFVQLWKNIIAPGMGFVIHVYKDDKCLASAVFLHWKHTLTYKYSATSGIDRQLAPTDLLLWTAVEWGCTHGYQVLDMGRSNLEDEGLRRFKRRWGAEEKPLVYSFISETRPKFPGGKLKGVLESLICHSPLWMCRLTGELLYGHFG